MTHRYLRQEEEGAAASQDPRSSSRRCGATVIESWCSSDRSIERRGAGTRGAPSRGFVVAWSRGVGEGAEEPTQRRLLDRRSDRLSDRRREEKDPRTSRDAFDRPQCVRASNADRRDRSRAAARPRAARRPAVQDRRRSTHARLGKKGRKTRTTTTDEKTTRSVDLSRTTRRPLLLFLPLPGRSARRRAAR